MKYRNYKPFRVTIKEEDGSEVGYVEMKTKQKIDEDIQGNLTGSQVKETLIIKKGSLKSQIYPYSYVTTRKINGKYRKVLVTKYSKENERVTIIRK